MNLRSQYWEKLFSVLCATWIAEKISTSKDIHWV